MLARKGIFYERKKVMSYLFIVSVIAVVIVVLAIASFTNFSLDNYHYDRLKWVVIRWSYLVTFIGVIVKTFDVPYGIETVTIVAGFGAMLAGLMNVSHSNFNGVVPYDIEGDDEVEVFDNPYIDEEGDE